MDINCPCGITLDRRGYYAHIHGGFHKANSNLIHYKNQGFKTIIMNQGWVRTIKFYRKTAAKFGLHIAERIEFNPGNSNRMGYYKDGIMSKLKLDESQIVERINKIRLIEHKKSKKRYERERRKYLAKCKRFQRISDILLPFPEIAEQHNLKGFYFTNVEFDYVLSPEGFKQIAVRLDNRTFIKDDNRFFEGPNVRRLSELQSLLDRALPFTKEILAELKWVRQGDWIFVKEEHPETFISATGLPVKNYSLAATRHFVTGYITEYYDIQRSSWRPVTILNAGSEIKAPDHPTLILPFTARPYHISLNIRGD